MGLERIKSRSRNPSTTSINEQKSRGKGGEWTMRSPYNGQTESKKVVMM